MRPRSRIPAALVASTALLAVGCAACTHRRADAAAAVRVGVRVTLASSAQVDAVAVEARPAGVSTGLARAADGAWTGTLEVPVGDQTFTATATSGGAVVGAGSSTATVADGQELQVLIRIRDTTGGPPGVDHAPVITSLVAPATVVQGSAATVAATAVDPDGDPITWSWTAPGCAGTFGAPAATTTWTPAVTGTCVLTVTATARGLPAAESVSIAVTGAATGGTRFWTENTVGAFGYFDGTPPIGLWDEAPGGHRDHLILVQGGTPAYAGQTWTNHLYVIHGPIGGPLSTQSIELTSVSPYGGAVNVLYTSVAWDTVHWKLHAISWAGDFRALVYTRLAPVRDGTGRITGFTKERELFLDLVPGSYGPAIAEVVDRAGNHRIAVVVVADTFVTPYGAIRSFVSTPAAGVEPAAESDFTGLDGTGAYTELFRFTWPGQGSSSMAAYGTSATLVQQPGSGNLHFFSSTGLHLQPGPHFHVQATASGTGWTVPPPASVTSYDDAGTNGAFARPGPGDTVWWIWDDGTDARISRVNADGSVTWDPLPPLGWLATYPGDCHLAIRGDEVVVILMKDWGGLWETRTRAYSGGAWQDWIQIATGDNMYTFGGFTGLGYRDGTYWTAAAASYKNDAAPRITAVSFPTAAPPP